jgi:PPK2 family polyphosphate:nucleotide phosphotransferase
MSKSDSETKRSKHPRLADVDLSLTLDRERYEERLAEAQHQLSRIQQSLLLSQEHAAVIVFEGWDAAGKGGTIRRMSAALDPRGFKVWPIGAPRAYYLHRHYLLRFMEKMPPMGGIAVFDRSWYGRVLVERVEGLTPKSRWRDAYREINDFETLLLDDGVRLVKIFMHISADEQLERFEKRLRDPMKRWKLSYEDFRNRARWADYERAIDDMFARTSTKRAPWHVIPANNKKHARIAAMDLIIDKLGKGLDLSPPTLDPEVLSEAEAYFELKPSLIRSLAGRTE